jgi:ubiquinone biosynthesis protein COQ9
MVTSNINDQIEKEKQEILRIFLKNAPFEGWSHSNLINSSKACNHPKEYYKLLFPNDIKSLTTYFNKTINENLTQIFNEKKENKTLKISEKIATLIEIKFSLYQKSKESIRCLFQYNLLPQNILCSQKSLWQTCNQIWYLAGDTSTDFNYYTKRSLLAFVYSSSLLYYLSDESENFSETKKFIRRKLDSVLKIGKWKASKMDFINKLLNA